MNAVPATGLPRLFVAFIGEFPVVYDETIREAECASPAARSSHVALSLWEEIAERSTEGSARNVAENVPDGGI